MSHWGEDRGWWEAGCRESMYVFLLLIVDIHMHADISQKLSKLSFFLSFPATTDIIIIRSDGGNRVGTCMSTACVYYA